MTEIDILEMAVMRTVKNSQAINVLDNQHFVYANEK